MIKASRVVKISLIFLSLVIAGYLMIHFINKPVMAAAASTQSQGSEQNDTLSEENQYTVNFYNGNEAIGTFQISPGDSYTLTQTGYIINGVSTDFTGKVKMENCAYGTYYGSPIIENTVVATFTGWQLNDSVLPNSGIWNTYTENILTVTAVWTPINFTATFINGEEPSVQSFNYFDGITLPTPTKGSFEFLGWETEDGTVYDGGDTIKNISKNITFTAQWSELYTVTLISPQHNTTYSEEWIGPIGYQFTLPTLTYGNYQVVSWGPYEVGSTYTITGKADLIAVWEGRHYNIYYRNLTFLGKTASVLWNYESGNYAPTEYEYGVGLNLSNIVAFWQPDGPYFPHLVFLGWYTNTSFTTEMTSIPTTSNRSIYLYAKWRYDVGNPSRMGTYTINNADPLEQEFYDQRFLGLNSDNLWQELKNIGITSLTFNFKMRSWGEGTQYVYVYSENGTQLRSASFESTSSSYVHSTQFTISLDELGACSCIYIRYQASSYKHMIFWTKSHYWYNDYIYMEMAYVVNASDIIPDPNDSTTDFTWHYQDPFD